MDITQLLLNQLGENGVESMATKIGANKQQTAKAIEGIVPTMLGAMSNNTQTKAGASGLLGALDRDHDGSILDDISGFVGQDDFGQGEGILKHVLGGNRNTVENGLSAKTGLNSSQVSQLLKMAAPLIMGFLGKQKRQQGGGFDLNSITGLLGGMAKTSDQNTGLDLGDILQVVGGLSGGNSGTQSSGGIGGLLGKLFGR